MTTVAILEDQRLLRDALVEMLAANGFSVTCASGDPQEVLASVRARPASLVLIDLFLGTEAEGEEPGGMQVLQELRRWAPDIKAVVMSAAYDETLVDRMYREGAAAYVDKNHTGVRSVVPTLKQILAGERIFPVPQSLGVAPHSQNPVLATLTTREREVLAQLSGGTSNPDIATRLSISERTVRAHISALYRKLGAENRTQLALIARKLGVTAPH